MHPSYPHTLWRPGCDPAHAAQSDWRQHPPRCAHPLPTCLRPPPLCARTVCRCCHPWRSSSKKLVCTGCSGTGAVDKRNLCLHYDTPARKAPLLKHLCLLAALGPGARRKAMWLRTMCDRHGLLDPTATQIHELSDVSSRDLGARQFPKRKGGNFQCRLSFGQPGGADGCTPFS